MVRNATISAMRFVALSLSILILASFPKPLVAQTNRALPFVWSTSNGAPVPIPPPTVIENGIEHPDVFNIVSCFKPHPNVEVWCINKPNVTQHQTDFPYIRFKQDDLVTIAAGGCVNRGGVGLTMERYVRPVSSDRSDDGRYYGSVAIPGVLEQKRLLSVILDGPIHINSDPGPDSYLKLYYEDDGYNDNGYWGKTNDPGWWDQCRRMDDAWVIVIIQHGCAAGGPGCQDGMLMDLISEKQDENGLLFNPTWRWEKITRLSTPVQQIFNWSFKEQIMPEDGVELGTKQPTRKNASIEACPQSDASNVGTWGRIGGHVNWQAATYTGRIQWYKHSGPGTDDDYNFYLSDRGIGALTIDTKNQDHGLVVEFDGDEIVDHINSGWWDEFHKAVDADDNCEDKGPNGCKPGRMIFNKKAIVTGLVGIECAHNPWTELHPAYAMAIQVKDDPKDETWALFVRNWGNEGYCGKNDEPLHLPGDSLTIFFPAPRVGSKLLETWGPLQFSQTEMTRRVKRRSDGVAMTFKLKKPELKSMVYGEVHLMWGK